MDAVSFVEHGLHLLRNIYLSKGDHLSALVTGITTLLETLAGIADAIKALAQFGFGWGDMMKQFGKIVITTVFTIGRNLKITFWFLDSKPCSIIMVISTF